MICDTAGGTNFLRHKAIDKSKELLHIGVQADLVFGDMHIVVIIVCEACLIAAIAWLRRNTWGLSAFQLGHCTSILAVE